MAFVVVIPARFASSRLPGKPLADICGKPMIQHVYEKACQSGASKVVIATDHQAVFDAATSFGACTVMTKESHESGTERLAEVVDLLALTPETIVVNVQGDEPLLAHENVDQVAALLLNSDAPMATLSVKIDSVDEAFNPNAVKVVSDNHNNALYFSRATIPYDRERFLVNDITEVKNSEIGDFYQRHVGIYAYRAGFIQEYIELEPSPLEKIEALEQLRVLFHGKQIKVQVAKITPEAGVDTPEDLARVVAFVNNG
ncbi:3-deoxy-manno-octulosonate cytidylyltransferase [Pseudoalteromonas denitrificans]|uniref:3-deoxy-manno-octulosonate cytidylyltransferase n=1 Tax=Pseudoalteromonas denitrificans DSM 6059 TaxID=1123010 RepID=A0A1I1NNX2_9GAMM|nr:3-deoxy-manno-octulosonate cytidylyltransferase [Pseudoalteromonas denitrificans]SFC96463.1 3-deoxy-manno-octulosonate cytidylyltransferase (CMP-KDO synthetase) [Pseudoalteromonas denitrificans DSM 6059]